LPEMRRDWPVACFPTTNTLTLGVTSSAGGGSLHPHKTSKANAAHWTRVRSPRRRWSMCSPPRLLQHVCRPFFAH
jgi:hypothetical protein